ncbi:MAG: NADH-quinone oxidoreductase subunit N [Planctomycetes bacterium]|nr:NADH-quinone oxidoreductase subunit N [Planctomycetota bacterium]
MQTTFLLLLPQTVVALQAALFILGGTFPIPARRWGPLALVALLLGGAALHYSSGLDIAADATQTLAVVRTPLTVGFQWATLVIGALLVLLSMQSQSASKSAAEFYGMFLLMLAGLMLVAVAGDLILLFLALELISIPTYVLLYLGRNDYASQEASTKYFLLSVFSAAILLYGFAFLYGLAGTTQLEGIRLVLSQAYKSSVAGTPNASGSVLGVVALVLITAGLGFKMAAVPFHFYAPDVYQGTSAFNAGVLAILPKAAGLVALIRVGAETMVGFETTGQQLTLIVAAITMTGGNCLALLQTNVRRMLAYSGVAHAGYMLIGVAVGFWESWNPALRLEQTTGPLAFMGLPSGVHASLLYLLAYSLTSAGLFGVLVYLARPGKQVEHVDDLTGLAKTQPLVAIVAAVFLFSLAGIPPLPGFWAKLSVFTTALSVRQETADSLAAVHPAFVALAVIGVINAAIGAVYYLRLISAMFLNEPLSTARPAGGRAALVSVYCAAVLVVLLGLIPGPVFHYLQQPARAAAVSATPAVGVSPAVSSR